MTRLRQMIGGLCPACLVYHDPPVCAHEPDAPCTRCNLPVGYLCEGMPPGECWWCWAGYSRVVAPNYEALTWVDDAIDREFDL